MGYATQIGTLVAREEIWRAMMRKSHFKQKFYVLNGEIKLPKSRMFNG